MILQTHVTFRSITHHRVQLGDPSQDVWDYHCYSFPPNDNNDFEIQGYCGDGNSPFRFISRKEGLFRLGETIKLGLADNISNWRFVGDPILIIFVKRDYNLDKFFSGGNSGGPYWFSSEIAIRLLVKADFKPHPHKYWLGRL